MSYNILLDVNDGGADFETAITAAGLGKFNLILLLISIPSGWAAVFDTKTMGYVGPVAQCDLELTLESKGLLNAITYIGIFSSNFIWGFLADSYGRKKLLVICYLLDTIFIFLSGISQNFVMLLVSKYMAGFVMNGPNAILISLLSEFHSAQHRTRFFLIQGMLSNLANVILPLMAWAIFRHNISFRIFEGLELHSWNLYILLCALPSLVSGFGNMLLPESPKFLMSTGRNAEAMDVFKTIYSWNTGKEPDTYPIKQLMEETNRHNNNAVEKDKDTESLAWKLRNIMTLFCPPHLWIIIFLSIVQMGYKMGLNSFKNWLPQLFTAINDYKQYHHVKTVDFCRVLDSMTHESVNISSTSCSINYDNDKVYTNLIIVQSASVLSFLVTGTIINRLGNKNMFIVFGVISGLCGAAVYYAQNSSTVVALSTVLTAVSAVNTVVLNVCVVEYLPTSLRTMAISLTRLVGLAETIAGNILFPYLLQAGCAPPFLYVGVVTIACSFLAVFLPNERSLH